MRSHAPRVVLAAAIAVVLGALAPAADATPPPRDKVIGGGYAAFVSNGSPGDNSYWVFARQKPNGQPAGRWYADVVIDFPGFLYEFQALYSVDCLEIDRATNTAWIDGTVIESPNPNEIGLRAFLWIKDGSPTGDRDQHAITPIPANSTTTCRDRPAPDFMESITSGDYRVRKGRR